MKRKIKLILSIVAVVCLVGAGFAVYLFDYLPKQDTEKPFHVSFSVRPDPEQATNETWRIVILNEATDVLQNVDILASYGDQMVLVQHFDELADPHFYFDLQQISGEGMTVDIYWDGGHRNFFCRNQDAVTE